MKIDTYKMLEQLAAKDLPKDSFNVFEEAGGNFDDAYRMGHRDGEVSLARRVIAMEGARE